MANPAVFTSSAGGDIGGGNQYTRLRGPLRMGYSTADPGGQTQSATVSPAGSAAAPMYSFITLPNAGLYGSILTTSAAELRLSVAGQDAVWFTSAGVGAGTALQSTGGVTQALYISQTTGAIMTSSGGGTAPAIVNSAAALVWDASRAKLCVYSTASGTAVWLGSAAFTSS